MHPSTQSLNQLLCSLNAVRNPGIYVYCQVPLDADLSGLPAVATFREPEGWTVILEENATLARGLEPRFRAAWITLTVYSDLEAVGSPPPLRERSPSAGSAAMSSPRSTTTICSCRWPPALTRSRPWFSSRKTRFPERTRGAKSRNWV